MKKTVCCPLGQNVDPQTHSSLELSDRWTTISASNIIGVLPVHAEYPDDYSVLYTTTAPANTSSKPLPTLKFIVATRLPTDFIHDFSPSGLSCWQTWSDRNPRETNLHVIISVASGIGQADSFYRDALQPLLAHAGGLKADVDYSVHYTTSEHTITELTNNLFLPRANRGINQVIILLSGDGGIVDIVNALCRGRRMRQYVRPNVALIPLGTGNALAHSLPITSDNTMGLMSLLRGHHQPLPLFQITFSPGARLLVNEGSEERELSEGDTHGQQPMMWGAVVASWGMHAGLVADSDTAEYRKYGVERFQMAAKEALYPADGSAPHKYRGRVSVLRKVANSEEWQELERKEHAYVLATFVSNLEKGFTISPASEPLDGRLRLVHFGPMSGDRVMEVMGLAYQAGKHVEHEAVGYEEIEGLKISFEGNEEAGRWRRICVDGKIIRVEAGGWVVMKKEHEQVVDIICM